MPMPRVGPFNPRSVQALRRRLRDDEGLRREALGRVREDLYGVVEEAFELSDRQRQEMRDQMPPVAARSVGEACAVALETGGEIEFRIRRNQPVPDLSAELYCRGGGDDIECGVRITWDK